MANTYDDIPAAVYDSSIREQFSAPEYALDDSNPRFYNFVCPNPECGDVNQPNKKKAYIYTDTWLYVCYKCTPKIPYAKWLREHDEAAYRRLLFNAFGPEKRRRSPDAPLPVAPRPTEAALPFKEGEIIPILSDHPLAIAGLNLCRERLIREEVYSDWFVCLQGDQFLDRDANGNYVLDEHGRPKGNEYRNRIIIPFYHFGGKWGQFDARAIDKKNPMRYRNFEGVKRSAYNIDFINYDEPIYILEGSIDSTFVPNAIAIGGIPHFDSVFAENPRLMANKDKVVVIWDNDDEGQKARAKTCEMGFKWFTWEGLKSKDINKAVMNGELPLDEDGFVRRDAIEARVRDPESASILFALKYGNMKKEAAKKKFEGIRKFQENKQKFRKPEVLF